MQMMNFSEANCTNCYKCLRNCKVKAIRLVDDQAQIDTDRCVACGQCFVVCPQNARSIISNVDKVKAALYNGRKMVVSLAPSYNGDYAQPKKLLMALRRLGFEIIEETALGADVVLNYYRKYIEENEQDVYITSCCPSVNTMIEVYYPELLGKLIPFQTPMITHGMMIKEKYGANAFVTFIGPCIAKKSEIENIPESRYVDAVLTFEEIDEWLDEVDINLNDLAESQIDSSATINGMRFPIDEGILKGLTKSNLSKHQGLKVSGMKELLDVFDSIKEGRLTNVIIEANTCSEGCIGGPARSESVESVYEAKLNLDKRLTEEKLYIEEHPEKVKEYLTEDIYNKFTNEPRLFKEFVDKAIKLEIPTKQQLKETLAKFGKYTKEDELNCGACGYNTCREKALADFHGMSHPEMCIPYMRTKAEKVSNTIFSHTPNVVIYVDNDLNIIEFNPTAEKLFNKSSFAMRERPISSIMNAEDFEKVRDEKLDIYSKKIELEKYNLILNMSLVYLEKEKSIMAIMNNITGQERRSKELAELREKTLASAQKVIDKQMRVAQEIAGLLGETTAETKVTLTKLQKVVGGKEGGFH